MLLHFSLVQGKYYLLTLAMLIAHIIAHTMDNKLYYSYSYHVIVFDCVYLFDISFALRLMVVGCVVALSAPLAVTRQESVEPYKTEKCGTPIFPSLSTSFQFHSIQFNFIHRALNHNNKYLKALST